MEAASSAASEDKDATESVLSSDSIDSDEELESVMDDLKEQMHQLYVATNLIQTQVESLFQRAKEDTTDWRQEPMRPRSALRHWLETHGYSTVLTLDEFLDLCMSRAVRKDLETRTLTFKPEDATVLWKGQRRITVFQMMAAIPNLFHSM